MTPQELITVHAELGQPITRGEAERLSERLHADKLADLYHECLHYAVAVKRHRQHRRERKQEEEP